MPSSEEWRPVVGWEGLYEVSSHGRVRSLDRRVNSQWGKTRLVPGRVLLPGFDLDGYPQNTLKVTEGGVVKTRTSKISRLVAEAFIPNPGSKPCVLHWDDIKTNNSVRNLRWGTHKENTADIVRNGNNTIAKATHCKRGHKFTPDNTYRRESDGRTRRCRTCTLDGRARRGD